MFSPIIGLITADEQRPFAIELSSSLNVPLLDGSTSVKSLDEGHFVLCLDDSGLSLAYTGRKQPGAIRVDFTAGSARHRRQFGGGKGQMIAKAIGLKSAYKPTVLDLTAGLGQDGFVLASLGCVMTLIERSPIVHALLSDGLDRAKTYAEDPALQTIVNSIRLHHCNGIEFLNHLAEKVDVIYLDPMFPSRDKSAKVKKEMQAFHALVGEDDDAGELLKAALACAKYRVVVKRPRIAQGLHEQYPKLNLAEPGLIISGKSSRYDIYPLAKMP